MAPAGSASASSRGCCRPRRDLAFCCGIFLVSKKLDLHCHRPDIDRSRRMPYTLKFRVRTG